MIARLITHLRGNAIAYVALFVALGGTSYAATALPRNSVGTPQLRRGAVTSSKLAGGLGTQVWGVTTINDKGQIVSSDPTGVHTKAWGATPSGVAGIVVYPHRIPRACMPIATAFGPTSKLNPQIAAGADAVLAGAAGVQVDSDGPSGVQVAIVCPRGS